MAITKDDVLHYTFNKENKNELNFIYFINKLSEKIIQKKIHHYVVVMDNLSIHKTKNLINTYFEKKMNIVYNTPYLSSFNCIEFAFRTLKKKIYSKTYEDINKVIEDSSKYLDSIEFKNCLKNNYKDTIENYLMFSEKYKYLNLTLIEK